MGSVWTVCEVLGRGSDMMVPELLATKLDATSSEVLAAGCGIPNSEGLATLLLKLNQSVPQSCLYYRGGNSPRFSIRKIFQFNPELGQKCSEITDKMFKRTKHL